MTTLLGRLLLASRAAARLRPTGRSAHRWHRFRWAGDDAFSGSSLYACRCGVVRPAP